MFFGPRMLKAKDVGVPSMYYLVHLNSLKHRWNLIGVGKITKKIVREVIMNTVVKNRPGPNFYLLKDKKSYILATSEMDGAHGLLRDATSLSNKLQQVLHGVCKQIIGKGILKICTKVFSQIHETGE